MHDTFTCPLKDARHFTGARAAVSFTSHMKKHGWSNAKIAAERVAQRAGVMRATAEKIAGQAPSVQETPGETIPPGGDLETIIGRIALTDKIADVNTQLDEKRTELKRLKEVSKEVDSLVSQLDILERAQRELSTLYGDSAKDAAE